MNEIVSSLFGGFFLNLRLFFTTLLVALPLGLIITFGSMSRFRLVKYPVKAFVWIIRGTPLMLQLFIVIYAPGILIEYFSKQFPGYLPDFILQLRMTNRMIAAIIAFSINYAAYFSEIYRGGIESIPKGQYEAGQVLGLTKIQVFFRIILLQVVKRIVPPMSNEIITLVKDTSLARVISIPEIIMCAERFTRNGLIGPLFSTGIYFLLFNGLLTLLFGLIERKMDYIKV